MLLELQKCDQLRQQQIKKSPPRFASGFTVCMCFCSLTSPQYRQHILNATRLWFVTWWFQFMANHSGALLFVFNLRRYLNMFRSGAIHSFDQAARYFPLTRENPRASERTLEIKTNWIQKMRYLPPLSQTVFSGAWASVIPACPLTRKGRRFSVRRGCLFFYSTWTHHQARVHNKSKGISTGAWSSWNLLVNSTGHTGSFFKRFCRIFLYFYFLYFYFLQ